MIVISLRLPPSSSSSRDRQIVSETMRRQANARASASVLSVATFALLFASLCRAQLSVGVTPTQPRSGDPSHVEQIWTLSATPEDPAATLDVLSITAPGNTFISFDPGAFSGSDGARNTVAVVRVVSDSASDFSSLSVLVEKRSDGWQQLNVYAGARLSDAVAEVILTQPRQLQLLRSSGNGDVVVGDQVLFGSTARSGVAQSGIDVSGFGTVFVQLTEPLEGRRVSLNVSGQADLQIEAPSLQLTSLSVANSGASSKVKLFANSGDCATTSVTLSTSGDVCWDIQHFRTASLAVSLSGSGSIAAVGDGSCDTETVAISGSGGATLDTMDCRQVQVNLSGSGDAVVQASQYLGGVVSGSGDVSYTEDEPRVMSDKNGQASTGSSKKIASRSTATPTKTCKKRAVPMNKLKSSNAAAGGFPPPLISGDSNSERHWDRAESDGDDGDDGDAVSSRTTSDKVWAFLGANLYVVLPASVFVAFWAVVLALSRRAHRRRRRDPEQQALLRRSNGGDDEDPPVYI